MNKGEFSPIDLWSLESVNKKFKRYKKLQINYYTCVNFIIQVHSHGQHCFPLCYNSLHSLEEIITLNILKQIQALKNPFIIFANACK